MLKLQSETLLLEIIIVDDCSRDKSLEIGKNLARQHPAIKVLPHEVNKSKGAALHSGFQHATGDYVGIQDTDLEYEPLEYRNRLVPLLQGEADVVFGSRYLRPGSRKALYFWHSWMNKTLTFMMNFRRYAN